MNKFIVSTEQAKKQLDEEKEQAFTVMMNHGKMSVEYFVPKVTDSQKPHRQDELYVITSGQSGFYRDGETISCSKGDVIFVPAGMDHRFVNFSEDFATWVIFYGDEQQ